LALAKRARSRIQAIFPGWEILVDAGNALERADYDHHPSHHQRPLGGLRFSNSQSHHSRYSPSQSKPQNFTGSIGNHPLQP
jgi:hypothetical protein